MRETARSPSAKRAPTFEEAKNRRQKVRAAGMNPDYWYPAAWDHELARGQVMEVKFWGRSIALFRGEDGALRAVEDRCAHRQLKLSKGVVTGCTLTCAYHGWEYDGDGPLRPHPARSLRQQGCRRSSSAATPSPVRYGIVWIFPGDAAARHGAHDPRHPRARGRRALGERCRSTSCSAPTTR